MESETGVTSDDSIKPFDELKWIMDFFDNAVDLSDEGIDRVRNFAFLWNIFEASACDKRANLNSIKDAVETLNNSEQLKSTDFEPFVDYFSNRYFNSNGDTTYSIDGLEFSNSTNDQVAKDKVESVLRRDEIRPKEIVKGLLYILYRFRNNLFHGNKQVVNLNTQIDNFIAANHILSIFLSIMKRNHLIV